MTRMSPQDTARPTNSFRATVCSGGMIAAGEVVSVDAVAIEELQSWQLLGDALEGGLRHDRPAVARDAPGGEIGAVSKFGASRQRLNIAGTMSE